MHQFNLRLICLLAVLTVSFSPFAFSAPFGFGAPKISATPTTATAPLVNGPIKILSPSEFKAQVDTLSKQNQQQLTDQLNQQLSKKQSLTPDTLPAPPPADEQGNPPPPNQSYQLQPAQTIQGPPEQVVPESTPGYVTQQPPRSQGQPIYNGWGNATPQPTPVRPAPNSPGQASPGWGIKY